MVREPATLPAAGGGHRPSLRLPRHDLLDYGTQEPRLCVSNSKGQQARNTGGPKPPDGHDQGRPRLRAGGPARPGHSLLSPDLLQDSEPW